MRKKRKKKKKSTSADGRRILDFVIIFVQFKHDDVVRPSVAGNRILTRNPPPTNF